MTTNIRAACPKVVIPEEVWKRLMAYILACPMEVGGIGSVELVGDTLIVTDVFLLEQEVTPVKTLLDGPAIRRFVTEWVRQGKDPEVLRFWWHSHADMPVFWSEIDMRTIRELSRHNYLVSLVGNHKLQTRTRITSSQPFPFAFDFVPVEVTPDLGEAVTKAAKEEVDKKVRTKRRLFSFIREKQSGAAPDDPLITLLDEHDEKEPV
ncbi:MAG TPA: hypothetical protein VL500_01055 [Candidatus Eisenbacteria bacterium]|jgi:hypothetical protein|nr:hypothetical protein [Candidatus Eisenbacteria bacterium]